MKTTFIAKNCMVDATWNILLQLAPWLLLGMLISGLIHVLLPDGFVRRRLRGTGGVVKAVTLGIPLPLCSCGVVPAGIGLKRDGASDGAAVGFLISTPQTGVDSILVSASFLGWPFALFKVFSAAVTGIVGGLLADRVAPTREVSEQGQATQHVTSKSGLRELFSHAIEILHSIWLWLVIGVLISAALDAFVPPEVFTRIAAWGSVTVALFALTVSIPLYVCSTASVPIAATLVANGLPPGAALIFLMAGPATNIATVGAVYRTFGRRTLVVYLATLIVGSIVFAMAFDWLLPQSLTAAPEHHHDSASWWSVTSTILLLVMIAWFCMDDLRRWLGRRGIGRRETAAAREIEVRGMTCNACVSRLEGKLRATEGITSARVELNPGRAFIEGDISDEEVTTAISECGFEAGATPDSEHVPGRR